MPLNCLLGAKGLQNRDFQCKNITILTGYNAHARTTRELIAYELKIFIINNLILNQSEPRLFSFHDSSFDFTTSHICAGIAGISWYELFVRRKNNNPTSDQKN